MLEFEVNALRGGPCVEAIERAIAAIDPLARVHAEIAAHRVRIATAKPRHEIAQVLKEAGYPPTPVL